MKKILLLIILILITASGYVMLKHINKPEESVMVLENKKILMVVAPIDFRDEEYLEPRKVLEAAGAEIKVASIQPGQARGIKGTEVEINLTVSEVDVDDFDAVVFVGGAGMAKIVGDESLQILAQKFYRADKLTTAICVAPVILAKAGVLSGQPATVCAGSESDLAEGGAAYTGEPVTAGSKIITANGPTAARQFGERIVEALK